MKIKVTNTYGDRESVQHHTIDDATLPECGRTYTPGADLDELWDMLWTFTGDGTGENENAYYEVEILDATNPALIGLGNEWC